MTQFQTSENRRRDPFYCNELLNIDISHVHIKCRDGVLLMEGHSTTFFLFCTSFMDEEADNFGKVIGL